MGDEGGGQLASPGTEDEVLEREKEREMAALVSAALADLDDRQRAVAALHSHGFTGSAIAEPLQTSERRVKHSMPCPSGTSRSTRIVTTSTARSRRRPRV